MKNFIPFYKMVASGNDFVVVDNRRQIIKDATVFARTICRAHQGIIADGLLLFESSKKANFKMRIINPDGSEAAACGNGFRCIALYAHEVLKYSSRMRFESGSGIIEAEVGSNGNVKAQLIKPRIFEMDGVLEVRGHRLHYAFLDTGVPHVVIFVEGLAKVEVFEIGKAIRQHGHFQPFGTNVNFVEVRSKKEIAVRTYERGVENETLACGTGSTASAVMSVLKGYADSPVSVSTRGGEKLRVDVRRKGNEVIKVYLEGKAQFVYEGKYFL
ncbi:MAG TPA: diaminopimelate epimerase [Candidatus Omnitrophota bacterium]|nr:diaminopimelate epimerase [Candidatus Omnitrophota bacterium]